MIIRFFYGFIYKNKVYGWHEKELYRLPQKIGSRYYSKKKCAKWGEGYFLGSDRKSKNQLKSMTVVIDKEIQEIQSDDCSF